MTDVVNRGSYVFEHFRLSADGTLLARNDEAIALPPKVLQTLLVLVRHAGEVVRKDDLLRVVWPDSFVQDTGLTRNISLLRQALGDHDQRLIVTVARVGYRFAEPVQRVDDVTVSTRGRRHCVPTDRVRCEHRQPVVGRDRELNLLRRALERVRDDRGGILAIAGEPGIGKTTVVET